MTNLSVNKAIQKKCSFIGKNNIVNETWVSVFNTIHRHLITVLATSYMNGIYLFLHILPQNLYWFHSYVLFVLQKHCMYLGHQVLFQLPYEYRKQYNILGNLQFNFKHDYEILNFEFENEPIYLQSVSQILIILKWTYLCHW